MRQLGEVETAHLLIIEALSARLTITLPACPDGQKGEPPAIRQGVSGGDRRCVSALVISVETAVMS
jgi:hypothetical protein